MTITSLIQKKNDTKKKHIINKAIFSFLIKEHHYKLKVQPLALRMCTTGTKINQGSYGFHPPKKMAP